MNSSSSSTSTSSALNHSKTNNSNNLNHNHNKVNTKSQKKDDFNERKSIKQNPSLTLASKKMNHNENAKDHVTSHKEFKNKNLPNHNYSNSGKTDNKQKPSISKKRKEKKEHNIQMSDNQPKNDLQEGKEPQKKLQCDSQQFTKFPKKPSVNSLPLSASSFVSSLPSYPADKTTKKSKKDKNNDEKHKNNNNNTNNNLNNKVDNNNNNNDISISSSEQSSKTTQGTTKNGTTKLTKTPLTSLSSSTTHKNKLQQQQQKQQKQQKNQDQENEQQENQKISTLKIKSKRIMSSGSKIIGEEKQEDENSGSKKNPQRNHHSRSNSKQRHRSCSKERNFETTMHENHQTEKRSEKEIYYSSKLHKTNNNNNNNNEKINDNNNNYNKKKKKLINNHNNHNNHNNKNHQHNHNKNHNNNTNNNNNNNKNHQKNKISIRSVPSSVEENCNNLLSMVCNNQDSEEVRWRVFRCISRVLKRADMQAFLFGSVALKTYLPHGDIDVSVFPGAPRAHNDRYQSTPWFLRVRGLLAAEGRRQDSLSVEEVNIINAEVKVVKCIVGGVHVDISWNQLGGISTLCFFENVDRHIGRGSLFKRSVLLAKAWCYYESRILGSHHSLISTYCLSVMILYIIHNFHHQISHPLHVLHKFLEYFSTFDWDTQCITLHGPVSIDELQQDLHTPPQSIPGAADTPLLRPEFMSQMVSQFGLIPDDLAGGFVPKHMNVQDPLRPNNNLGRSVNQSNFFRIMRAFAKGRDQLSQVIAHNDASSLIHRFFINTYQSTNNNHNYSRNRHQRKHLDIDEHHSELSDHDVRGRPIYRGIEHRGLFHLEPLCNTQQRMSGNLEAFQQQHRTAIALLSKASSSSSSSSTSSSQTNSKK